MYAYHEYLGITNSFVPILGAYAEWISAHPEVLSSVIPLLLQGLQNTELAQSATLSLKEVVRENQAHLMPFVSSILSISKVSVLWCRI